jgi:uroporphyrinogen decarboxylase
MALSWNPFKTLARGETMTHRERVFAALKHQQPDRVPLDLGASASSTVTARFHERLRAHLNLPAEPPPVAYSRRNSTVIPDDVILERFGVDTRPVFLGIPDARPERDIDAHSFVDDWGVTWHRPTGGHFINSDGPFYKLTDPAPKDLDGYAWPDANDPGRYRGLRDWARRLHEQSDCAVVLNLVAGPVHQSQFLRGYEEWLEDLMLRPQFVEALADRIVDVWVGIATRALEEAGEYVDLVTYGDDIAVQRSPLMRPELYRKLIKPRHQRMAAAVKRFGKPILYHSCGSVSSLIPDMIEIGIDALNPVQVAAANMDTGRLKQEYGRDITFWGAIDTQRVLPLGTPEEVRAEVKRVIGDLAPGGGYVLCPVHNVQPEVPPANIVAMFDAALEFGQA